MTLHCRELSPLRSISLNRMKSFGLSLLLLASTGFYSEILAQSPTQSVVDPLDDQIPLHQLIEASLRKPFWDHPALQGAARYRIDLRLDSDLGVYHASMRLDYTNQERDTLTELNFLLYPNSSELSGQSERRLIITEADIDGTPVPFDRLAREVLTLPLHKPLLPGERLVAKISFKGSLFPLPPQQERPEIALEDLLQTVVHQSQPNGGYGVFSQGSAMISMALWYPILVAYDDDGWDMSPTKHVGDRSYFDIAHYDVSLSLDSEAHVATTGVEWSQERRGRGRYARYVAAGVREFTLQTSRDYVEVTGRHADVTVRSLVTRRHQVNNQPVLNEAISALSSFEGMFGAYPYRELEIAESPLVGGAGGVEFPGLITIGSTIYQGAAGLGFFDPNTSSRSSTARQKRDQKGLSVSGEFMQETRDFVVAHEVAHQWWAAVVGSDSRTHPFVDEALANYSAAAHFQRTRGPSATQRQIDMMMRLNYHLARFSGMEDQPVDQPTESFDGLLSYGAIIYGKGALFFWKLRQVLGTKSLHDALSKYYQKYLFRVANGPSLRTALAEGHPHREQVIALTKRWLDETHGDEDIDGVSLYRAMKIMMGEVGLAQLDPELRRWLNHRGVDALAELVEHALRTGKIDRERVDYAAITSLLSELMQEDPRVAKWAGVAGRVLANPDAQPSDVLKEAGRAIRKEDPKTALILESAGLLLDALMMEDPRKTQETVPQTPKVIPQPPTSTDPPTE